jgi:hypothetical protein
MPGYTVFDNNAYKRVHPERLERLIAAERDHAIVPMANVIVLQEMLARVRDPDLRVRGRNRAAIRKMGQHCRAIRVDGGVSINFLAPTDSQVYQLLAGKAHPHDREMCDTFAEMIRVVSAAGADSKLLDIADDLARIEAMVAHIEAEYVARLRAAATATAEPQRTKRNLAYANIIALRAGRLYGRRFTAEEIIADLRIIQIAKLTEIGFTLQDSIIAEVRRNGGGHDQHANSAWDEEVVSSTSIYARVNGRPVRLVTEEKRLLAAAESAKAAGRVCDVAAYEAFLGLPPWPGKPDVTPGTASPDE